MEVTFATVMSFRDSAERPSHRKSEQHLVAAQGPSQFAEQPLPQQGGHRPGGGAAFGFGGFRGGGETQGLQMLTHARR